MMTDAQIEADLAKWAKQHGLTDAEWTQDASITAYSGRTPDGGYRFYAFARLDRHKILENSKIVSGAEVASARLGVSPYLAIKAACYNELAARLAAERAKTSLHAVEDRI